MCETFKFLKVSRAAVSRFGKISTDKHVLLIGCSHYFSVSNFFTCLAQSDRLLWGSRLPRAVCEECVCTSDCFGGGRWRSTRGRLGLFPRCRLQPRWEHVFTHLLDIISQLLGRDYCCLGQRVIAKKKKKVSLLSILEILFFFFFVCVCVCVKMTSSTGSTLQPCVCERERMFSWWNCHSFH